MKKKTLIKLFLTSSIFLLLAGCNKEVKPVTSEVVSESVKVVSGDTSIEDTSIEETVSEKIELDVTSEVESVDTSEDVSEVVETDVEVIEVETAEKKSNYVAGMPSTDLEKYNKYIASTEQTNEPTSEVITPAVTPKQTEQKKETKKQVVKEEVKPEVIDVTNPSAEAALTNISQEMANLLNAKRGELGFPQTVEVIPESDIATHNFSKQATINLATIEFSHESGENIASGIKLDGTVIGQSTLKDSNYVFNGWMNSPGHYDTIIPNGGILRPEEVMQVISYVYGPYNGNYYYSLSYRIKMNNVELEDWQKPYIDESKDKEGPSTYVDGDTGYIDNYADEIILDSLIGTDDFWEFFDTCTPELQEHYRQKHPELFN